MIKILLSFCLILNSLPYKSWASGPGDTGGGEPEISQKMSSLIHSVPAIISAKGIQYFPEINLNKLVDFLSSNKIEVELEDNIIEEGSRKLSRCYSTPGHYKVSIDPKMWETIQKKNDLDITVRAHAVHEVLCLMKIESNNDYHISDRVRGIEVLASMGIKSSTNQIYPEDYASNEIIYWTDSPELYRSFFYCSDRNNSSTCRRLGNRAYSRAELVKFSQELLKKNQQLDLIKYTHYSINALGVAYIITNIFLKSLPWQPYFVSFFSWALSPVTNEVVGEKKEAGEVILGLKKSFPKLSRVAKALHEELLHRL